MISSTRLYQAPEKLFSTDNHRCIRAAPRPLKNPSFLSMRRDFQARRRSFSAKAQNGFETGCFHRIEKVCAVADLAKRGHVFLNLRMPTVQRFTSPARQRGGSVSKPLIESELEPTARGESVDLRAIIACRGYRSGEDCKAPNDRKDLQDDKVGLVSAGQGRAP
jgi:hypothetical protein